MTDILDRVAELREAGASFVLATVVASYPPQSVRAGAKAVILADGTIEGWLGGGCVRPVVLEEAREALAAGAPRLVRMNAGMTRAESVQGVRDYPMTCQGEGGVEIYLEPMQPLRRLCVLGDTPVARALAALAKMVGYVVIASPNDADTVVVATMGMGDEEALTAAATSGAAYVGLVASRKKAAFLFDYLRANGVPNEQLARVKAPAGLDLGGMQPEEIALSIVAEIVQHRCHPAPLPVRSAPPVDTMAVDPVCGMTVEKTTAKHTVDVAGETFYFCCPGCKTRFAKAPLEFVRGEHA